MGILDGYSSTKKLEFTCLPFPTGSLCLIGYSGSVLSDKKEVLYKTAEAGGSLISRLDFLGVVESMTENAAQ